MSRRRDQPPGIHPDSTDLPPLEEATKRVRTFLEEWGDGRIDDPLTLVNPAPLYARDLEVLVRQVDRAARNADA